MKFYLIPGTDHAPAQLAATQAEGASICKERALKFDPVAMAHDVPTDPKAALQAYVNDLLAKAHGAPAQECPSCHGLNLSCPDGCGRDAQTGELDGSHLEPAPPTPEPVPTMVRQVPGLSPHAIEEWILDHATVAQAEQLFARLGTRFAELVRGR